MGRMWPPQRVKMWPTPACLSVRATRCPPLRSGMVSFSPRACGPSDVETVEAEEIVGDGEDLDIAEPRLEGIATQGGGTHDRARARRRLLGQSGGEAAQHAEPVHHALDHVAGSRERLGH